MNWTLGRKVGLVGFTLLGVIILMLSLIALSLQRQNAVIEHLNRYIVPQALLADAYDVRMQRLLAEILAFVYRDEEDEADEGVELIEEMEDVLATIAELNDLQAADLGEPELLAELQSLLTRRAELLELVSERANLVFAGGTDPSADELEELGEFLEDVEVLAFDISNESSILFDEQISEDVALVEDQASLSNALSVFAVVVLVGLIVILLFLNQRQVVQPIQRLARAAKAVREGDFEQSVTVTNRDEIGSLQQVFNEMVTSLRQQQVSLTDQNQELQRALTDLKTASEEQETLQEQIIAAQGSAIRRLSSPIIPIAEGIVVVPLVGAIDAQRAEQMLERLLQGVSENRTQTVIIDVTGVDVIEPQIASMFGQIAQAVRLLGARVVLTGIRPQAAQALVHIGAELNGVTTHSTLQTGIAATLLPGTNGSPPGDKGVSTQPNGKS